MEKDDTSPRAAQRTDEKFLFNRKCTRPGIPLCGSIVYVYKARKILDRDSHLKRNELRDILRGAAEVLQPPVQHWGSGLMALFRRHQDSVSHGSADYLVIHATNDGLISGCRPYMTPMSSLNSMLDGIFKHVAKIAEGVAGNVDTTDRGTEEIVSREGTERFQILHKYDVWEILAKGITLRELAVTGLFVILRKPLDHIRLGQVFL